MGARAHACVSECAFMHHSASRFRVHPRASALRPPKICQNVLRCARVRAMTSKSKSKSKFAIVRIVSTLVVAGNAARGPEDAGMAADHGHRPLGTVGHRLWTMLAVALCAHAQAAFHLRSPTTDWQHAVRPLRCCLCREASDHMLVWVVAMPYCHAPCRQTLDAGRFP